MTDRSKTLMEQLNSKIENISPDDSNQNEEPPEELNDIDGLRHTLFLISTTLIEKINNIDVRVTMIEKALETKE